MKRRFINKLMAGVLLIGSVVSLAGGVKAGAETLNGWVNKSGIWYYYDNGVMQKDTTITVDGENYKFDSNGQMVQSEEQKQEAAKRREENKKKRAEYNAKYPETKECSEDYKKRDDRWTSKDGNWYFAWKFDGDNEFVDYGWEEINGFWYYFNENGVMQKNVTIKDEAGKDCVLNADGALSNKSEPEFKFENDCKLEVIDGKSYFIDLESNNKQIGWVIYDGKWYHTNANGEVEKNKTIQEGDTKYVLGADGAWVQ